MEPKPQGKLFIVPATGAIASHRKAASINRIKVDHELAKSRYYYHRRLDRALFKYDGAKRIIECGFASFADIPTKKKQQFYVAQLLKLGYNVQYRAVDVPAKAPHEPSVAEMLQLEYLEQRGI